MALTDYQQQVTAALAECGDAVGDGALEAVKTWIKDDDDKGKTDAKYEGALCYLQGLTGAQFTARNEGLDRSEWAPNALPRSQDLAEAAAIFKGYAGRTGELPPPWAAERVAVQMIDLTDAFRELFMQGAELPLQCFVWRDGVRIDLRAVFGTAFLVDFFQRISQMVNAVARDRIRRWFQRHYTASEARRRWADAPPRPSSLPDVTSSGRASSWAPTSSSEPLRLSKGTSG